jgi:hypothetical protein
MPNHTSRPDRLLMVMTNTAILTLGVAVMVGIAILGLARQGLFSRPKGAVILVPLGLSILWSLVCTWICWRARNVFE